MSLPGTSMPKVTVITPTYNSAATIEVCLKSVAQQSYLNKEHLIIDGQSKDETLAIVKQYQALYPHIRYVSEQDKGIWDAMNKGIDLSAGEWLYFMGGDDALYDDHVLTTVFTKNDTSAYDIIYGNIQHLNTGTQFDNEFTVKLLARFNIAHQAIFYRKKLFDKIGKYSLVYHSCSDYAVNIKWFGDETVRRSYIKDIICVYNEAGMSSVFFDRPFYRDKPALVLKFLKFEKPEDFTDAARHTIYTQLKNDDVTGALSNLRLLFKHAGPSFDKWLFIKEFVTLIFNKNDTLAGQKFKKKI
jgi:glycosyltransferase involved in cell wall biosynthesis